MLLTPRRTRNSCRRRALLRALCEGARAWHRARASHGGSSGAAADPSLHRQLPAAAAPLPRRARGPQGFPERSRVSARPAGAAGPWGRGHFQGGPARPDAWGHCPGTGCPRRGGPSGAGALSAEQGARAPAPGACCGPRILKKSFWFLYFS